MKAIVVHKPTQEITSNVLKWMSEKADERNKKGRRHRRDMGENPFVKAFEKALASTK